MTDHEAAAWTRGHAVGARELKAAEQRWQAERAGLIAQRNLWADEANEARAEIQRLRWQWYRVLVLMGIAIAIGIGIGWTVAILLGVV
jgi:hypothetical protein